MSHFAAKTERILRDEKFTLAVFRNKRSMIAYEPLGVVGSHKPLELPLLDPGGRDRYGRDGGQHSRAQAFRIHAAGRATRSRRLFAAAGFPEGVLEVVQGDGSTGAALVESAVDKIFFTGSVRTGKKIAEVAASRLLPVVLELGGKDPMIVCEDAPVRAHGERRGLGRVRQLRAGLRLGREALRDGAHRGKVHLRRRRRGEEAARRPAFGRLLGRRGAAREREPVERRERSGRRRGGEGRAGARGRAPPRRPGGYFFEPTVLVDVNSSMKVMTEETFGPVLPIMVVKDEEEAIREANNTRYGLLASVWTGDNERGRRIARKIEAGTVIINDAVYTHGAAQTPWFGVKESGLGVTHGSAGLFEFVRMKHVNWDMLPLKSDWWWYPYTEEVAEPIQDSRRRCSTAGA